jgi:calcineurin-like phosphoesterase family protein
VIRYCDRPFADVDEMNEQIIERWNESVEPDDTVWVLGDVAMGQVHDSLPLVGQLHGHKILVAGNHDRCWHGHGAKAHEWVQRYLRAGFERIIHDVAHLTLDGADGTRTRVLASHFPYHGDTQPTDRYLDHRPRDRGDWLLHGHVHERWRQHGRQINVGVDAWDYRPVSEATVAELVRSGPVDLERLTPTRITPTS